MIALRMIKYLFLLTIIMFFCLAIYRDIKKTNGNVFHDKEEFMVLER